MKKHILFRGVLIACVTFSLACATDTAKNNVAPEASAEIKPALDSVTSDKLLRHIKTLASDEFEGRAPGTKGEDLTVGYLTEQFKRLGLKPGNPDCSMCQMSADPAFGPMFWHLDGSGMDLEDNWVFSFHPTREDWEAERRRWEEMSRKFNEEHAQREAETEWAGGARIFDDRKTTVEKDE